MSESHKKLPAHTQLQLPLVETIRALGGGKPSWLIRPHTRLPLTEAALERHLESADDFACRRIHAIAKHIAPVKLNAWRLRVAAGVGAGVAKRLKVRTALAEYSQQ